MAAEPHVQSLLHSGLFLLCCFSTWSDGLPLIGVRVYGLLHSVTCMTAMVLMTVVTLVDLVNGVGVLLMRCCGGDVDGNDIVDVVVYVTLSTASLGTVYPCQCQWRCCSCFPSLTHHTHMGGGKGGVRL
jgi:hypothetical protein